MHHLFFWKDSRSIALSFKKKKKEFYITSQNEHHHNTINTHEQCTQQNTTPPQPGRRAPSKPLRTAPSSPMLCHFKVAAHCKPERQLEELLHQVAITLQPNPHDRRPPCSSVASAEHSRHSTNENHWSWPHCVGVSPHLPPHTPLPNDASFVLIEKF
jgi:hypothetical protein